MHAACHIPKLVLMATFGDAIVVQSIKTFMEQWHVAEQAISQANLDTASILDIKDRGPLFFWLLNECAIASFPFANKRPNMRMLHSAFGLPGPCFHS